MLYSLFYVKLHKNINISQLYLLHMLSNLQAQDLRSFNAKNSTLSRITRRCFRIYFVAGLRPIKTKKQHPFRFFFMKSARRVAVILWMTLLCRSNDRAGRRDFEPSSPGLGSFNAKNSTLLGCCFFALKKRETGIEPAAPSLARRCSTTEPLAHCTCASHARKILT